MATKYVFDKVKVIQAIDPKRPMDVMYAMRLSPSQMQTFFICEPSVERLLDFGRVTGLNPMDFVCPAPTKLPAKESLICTPETTENPQ